MALTVEQLEIEILNLSNEARTKLVQRLLGRLDAIADIELVLSTLMKWRKPATNPCSINRNRSLNEKNPFRKQRGIATVKMSTDEIMSLTRGE